MKTRYTHASLLFSLVLMTTCFFCLSPNVIYAATIVVDTTDYGPLTDSACSLYEAIQAANTNSPVDSCTAGDDSPIDLIQVPSGIYPVSGIAVGSDGETGLPVITSTIVITGEDSIIARDIVTPVRIFYVEPVGNLTLEKLVLSDGSAQNGGNIYNLGSLTVTESSILSGTAQEDGGGVYSNGATATFSETEVLDNTANRDGGGIYNTSASTVTLVASEVGRNNAATGGGIANFASILNVTESKLFSNTVTGSGGAIHMADVNAIATILGGSIEKNSAEDGGGIYSFDSTISISGTQVLSNTATGFGGGIANIDSAKLDVVNAIFSNNQAAGRAGAVGNSSGQVTVDNSSLTSNLAESGGAISNESSGVFTVTNSTIASNTVTENGGGLYIIDSAVSLITTTLVANSAGNDGGGIRQENESTLSLVNSEVISNSAANNGGGISSQNSDPEITSSELLSNTAGNAGGALHNADANAVISDTLFITNSASGNGGAIANAAPSLVNLVGGELRANHAANGGALSNNGIVNISQARLLTNTASGSGGAIYQTLNGATNVSQSCIVGNSDIAVHHVDGPAIVASNNWWGAPNGPSGVGPGVGDSVSTNVTFSPFHTFAILDCPGDPAVAWSAAAYYTSETSGNFTATVLLSPTVSFTSVTVIATIEGQPDQTVTFSPNVGSQPVVIQVVNDSVYTGQVIDLALESPNGAIFGNPIAATLTITDDEAPSVALAVTKVANLTSARVGDLITYTYRITNTGQTPLTTITATDDKLGVIVELAGALAVSGTRTASVGYVVQMADFAASPLVNVVNVEGSTSAGAIAEAEASTSVPIRRRTTIAVVILKGEVVEE